MASELPPNALGKLASSVKNIVTGVPLEDQNETNAPATKQVDKSLDKTVDKTVETTDDATIHKEKQAPVVHEDVKSHEHEKVDTEVDHEVHQDHYHTTIQPVKDKNVLPTEHVYKENEVEEEIDHRNNEAKMKAKEEAARIKNEKNVEDTTHSREYAPTKEHEHIHHHLHENIQPVIERETVQQKVIHTKNHIHEKEQLNDEYHEATVAPTISLDEFKNGGAKTGTTVTKDIEMPVSGVKATAKKREALGDVDVEEASKVDSSTEMADFSTPLTALRATAETQPYATAVKQEHNATTGLRYSDVSYHQFENDIEATASYWKKTFLPHDISE
ncbi:hypothetical protein FOBRF1_016146 [Fusarium oxysporum]